MSERTIQAVARIIFAPAKLPNSAPRKTNLTKTSNPNIIRKTSIELFPKRSSIILARVALSSFINAWSKLEQRFNIFSVTVLNACAPTWSSAKAAESEYIA